MDLSMLELSDQEIARRTSLNELRSLGINPYPAAEYQVTAYAQEIINSYPEGNEEREALLRETGAPCRTYHGTPHHGQSIFCGACR